jgi:catechol 2,3-dioxygenase
MQDFYAQVLGMVISDTGIEMLFKRRIIFMTGDSLQHHQFVLVVREQGDPPGGAPFQVSFKVKSLNHLREVTARALARGATDLRQYNHGNSWSVHFLDPDGNMIEVYFGQCACQFFFGPLVALSFK